MSSRDDMRCTNVSVVTAPSSGNAAARRITLAVGSTRFGIANFALSPGLATAVYYLFGDSSVDCSGVANANGIVMQGKETGMRVPANATHASLKSATDSDVAFEEGVTT
jgi:hypothetical protein